MSKTTVVKHSHPLIGLSSCIFHHDPERPVFKGKALLYAEEMMVHWIARAGGMVMVLPRLPAEGPEVKDYISLIDGLILQGGVDVAPESYGEKALKPEWHGDAERDRYESELIHEAMKQNKPILGVCRGLQILNVALGGSLYQDITTQKPGAAEHRNWHIYEDNKHEARIVPGSGFAKLFPGEKKVTINSIHHQGIKKLAPGFTAEVISEEDDVIEAIRHEEKPYIVGVQWHPEFQRPEKDEELIKAGPIMAEFMAAVRSKKQS